MLIWTSVSPGWEALKPALSPSLPEIFSPWLGSCLHPDSQPAMGLTSSTLAAQRQSLLCFTQSESHEVNLNLSYICIQAVLLQATSSGVNLVNSLSPNIAWSKVLLFTCSLLQSQKCLRATPPETGQKVWKTSFIRKPRMKWGSPRYWEQSTRTQNRRQVLYKVLSPRQTKPR